MKRLHKTQEGQAWAGAVMFSIGLAVLVVLVVLACGESDMPRDALDQGFVETLLNDETLQLLSIDDTVWPENDSEMSGLPEEDETMQTASSKPHTIKEQAGDLAVWKVVLVLAILLLAVVGGLSTVYYLCVWRGGRIHYKPQKDTSST